MVPAAAVARLTGQVVDGRSHAVPEARVLAFRIADGGSAGGAPGGAAATADLDGHFSIDGLAPGTYRVLVEAAGFPAAETSPVTAPAAELVLRVAGEGRLIFGRVARSANEPVAGARVALGAEGGGPGRETISRADGRFAFSGLGDGTYALRARPRRRGVGNGSGGLRQPRRCHDSAAPGPSARGDDRRAARSGRRRRSGRLRGPRRVWRAAARRRPAAGGRANRQGRRVHARAARGRQLPGDRGAGRLRPAPRADRDLRGARRPRARRRHHARRDAAPQARALARRAGGGAGDRCPRRPGRVGARAVRGERHGRSDGRVGAAAAGGRGGRASVGRGARSRQHPQRDRRRPRSVHRRRSDPGPLPRRGGARGVRADADRRADAGAGRAARSGCPGAARGVPARGACRRRGRGSARGGARLCDRRRRRCGPLRGDRRGRHLLARASRGTLSFDGERAGPRRRRHRGRRAPGRAFRVDCAAAGARRGDPRGAGARHRRASARARAPPGLAA